MKRNTYRKGDWLAVCDSCGRVFYASALRKRWDNMMVCKDDYETRNPQDFARGIPDYQSPPWVRPKPDEPAIIEVTGTGSTILPNSTYSVYVTDSGGFYAITLPNANANPGFTLRTGPITGTCIISIPGGNTSVNYPGALRPNTTYLISSNGSSVWTFYYG